MTFEQRLEVQKQTVRQSGKGFGQSGTELGVFEKGLDLEWAEGRVVKVKAESVEGHRKAFRFHSECSGKSLEGLEQESDVVLFIPIKGHLH